MVSNVFGEEELGVSFEYYSEVPSQLLLAESQVEVIDKQADEYEIIPDLDDLIDQKGEEQSEQSSSDDCDNLRQFVRSVLAAEIPVIFAQ